MLSLKNKSFCLTLAPEFGSNLVSLKYKSQELIYLDQKILTQRGFTGCFVLWPFPNRVKNREYQFNGQKYSLKNLQFYHHAFARGLKWQVKSINPTKVKTWYNHTQSSVCWPNYPWHCCLTLTYTLISRGFKIEYRVENFDKSELGFGFGMHPLFKNVQAIKIPAKSVMEADKDLLPTGKLRPAKLNKLTPVKDLDLDHVFTDLTGPQIVKFKNNLKLKITTSPDFTHCVVYTGEKDKYTAVEQQTCSTDAHNLDALGFTREAHLIRVKPSKITKGWIKYEVR